MVQFELGKISVADGVNLADSSDIACANPHSQSTVDARFVSTLLCRCAIS